MTRLCLYTNYVNTINYGAVYQAYSLSEYLSSLGCSVRILDIKRSKKQLLGNLNLNTVQSIPRILLTKLVSKQVGVRRQAFSEFRAMVPREALDYNSLDTLTEKYDCFVCGSDQIWRPLKLNGLIEETAFLGYSGDKPSISYAASMGVDSYSENNAITAKRLLSKIDHISVREENTCDYLRGLTGRQDITTVCDPVLLHTAQYWESKESPFPIEGRYILTYFIGNDRHRYEVISEYVKRHALKIVNFPFMSYVYRRGESKFGDYRLFDSTPPQWLYLIRNAELVITDSYHSTLFSILFHKRFRTITRDVYTSRFGIVKKFGLGNRLVDLSDLTASLEDPEVDNVNWKDVDARIAEFCEYSQVWLKSALASSTGETK